jgi:hypothetical protein
MPNAVNVARLVRVYAQCIEHARHGDFVFEREVDAARLRAVAQRRVEQVEAFPGHTDAFGGQTAVSWSGC